MSVRVDFHRNLNVIQISAQGESVFIRRDQATAFLALFMDAIADSAPTSAPLLQGAAGNPESPIGNGGAEHAATREGAGHLYLLDNRRHSVHADLFACDPDESGGLAS